MKKILGLGIAAAAVTVVAKGVSKAVDTAKAVTVMLKPVRL